MQDDLDRVAVARERLVDGVVDDLVDEVVEAALAGRADVHPGTLANGLEALEDGDVGGLVAGLRCGRGFSCLLPFGLGRLAASAARPRRACLARPVFLARNLLISSPVPALRGPCSESMLEARTRARRPREYPTHLTLWYQINYQFGQAKCADFPSTSAKWYFDSRPASPPHAGRTRNLNART